MSCRSGPTADRLLAQAQHSQGKGGTYIDLDGADLVRFARETAGLVRDLAGPARHEGWSARARSGQERIVLRLAGRAGGGDPPDEVALAERARRAAPGTLGERDAAVAGAGDERRVGRRGRRRDEGGGGDDGEDSGEAHGERRLDGVEGESMSGVVKDVGMTGQLWRGHGGLYTFQPSALRLTGPLEQLSLLFLEHPLLRLHSCCAHSALYPHPVKR